MSNSGEGKQSEWSPYSGRSRRYRWGLAIAVAILSSILVIWLVIAHRMARSYTLPDLQNVASIRAYFVRYWTAERTVVEFDLPRDSWEHIFNCLTPSQYDPTPPKWQEIGMMRVWDTDGHEVQIYLYDTQSNRGAYSVGPSMNRRTYYRGGDPARLGQALREACSRIIETPADGKGGTEKGDGKGVRNRCRVIRRDLT